VSYDRIREIGAVLFCVARQNLWNKRFLICVAPQKLWNKSLPIFWCRTEFLNGRFSSGVVQQHLWNRSFSIFCRTTKFVKYKILNSCYTTEFVNFKPFNLFCLYAFLFVPQDTKYPLKQRHEVSFKKTNNRGRYCKDLLVPALAAWCTLWSSSPPSDQKVMGSNFARV
jgi:hypothetical protein